MIFLYDRKDVHTVIKLLWIMLAIVDIGTFAFLLSLHISFLFVYLLTLMPMIIAIFPFLVVSRIQQREYIRANEKGFTLDRGLVWPKRIIEFSNIDSFEERESDRIKIKLKNGKRIVIMMNVLNYEESEKFRVLIRSALL